MLNEPTLFLKTENNLCSRKYFVRCIMLIIVLTLINSFFNPSISQVNQGYLFSANTLTNTTATVPSGESWKLVSMNRSPQLGPITVNIPFFEPYLDKCIYAFTPSQRYNLLKINSLQYAVGYPYTYPNSGTMYQIFKDCGGAVCPNCPSFQTISFTPDYSILTSIKLPLWINSGSQIEVADGVILSIEKYHN